MKKYDSLLKKVELFERLSLFGDRKAFLQSLAQSAPSLEGTVPSNKHYPGPDVADWQKYEPSTTTIPQPPAAESTVVPASEQVISVYPRISKDQQESLSRVTTVEGIGLPLKIDGVLGPKTKAAVEAFKKFVNQPRMTDQQAFNIAKEMTNELPKYKS